MGAAGYSFVAQSDSVLATAGRAPVGGFCPNLAVATTDGAPDLRTGNKHVGEEVPFVQSDLVLAQRCSVSP